MINRICIALLLLLPVSGIAQTNYDTLRSIYSTANVIKQQRELKINFLSEYIAQELDRIIDPEIKQLAACAFAENLYGYGLIPDKDLSKMVDDVLKAPTNEVVRTKAVEVRAELTRSLVNTKVKPLAFPTVQGDTIKLTDLYTSGKDYIVIDFWATWCGPCVASMKKFNDLKQKYNIEVYSISLDNSIDKVQKFVVNNPSYTWPIVYGGKENGLHAYFKIRFIPMYFIVDKTGLILSSSTGNDLERELKKLYRK